MKNKKKRCRRNKTKVAERIECQEEELRKVINEERVAEGKKSEINIIDGCEVDKIRDELSLNFSQRKDRFLVVATVISALVYVLNCLRQSSAHMFSKMYFNHVNVFNLENVFVSGEQIISCIYLSSILCIVIIFLIYGFFELRNLQSLRNDCGMQDIADEWYASAFKIAFILLIYSAIITGLLSYVFSDNKIQFYVLGLCLIIFSGVILLIFQKDKKSWDEVKRRIFEIIGYILCHIGLSILIFCIFFLQANKMQGTMNAYFDNEQVVLEFEGGYYPSEVCCKIADEESIEEKTFLFEDYGECAWFEKISTNEKGKDDNITINDNYYYYRYIIDIENMHERGNYIIEIDYTINTKEYHIGNRFHYDNGCYNYIKNHMQIEL